MNLVAFEPFGKLDLTKPFKLVPLGTWHRGDRKLYITEDRLREIEENVRDGLPNFRIPINLDHVDSSGKVGDIKAVSFMPQGEKGPGLYVTDYELTEAGEKAIEEKGYDAVSAEIVWTLNGATYEDPRNGQQHDNVLVGVALTPYPYFGHNEVALYSAHVEYPEGPGMYRPYGGSKSFGEYDAWLESEMQLESIRESERIFRGLMDNISMDDQMPVEERADAIKKLADEFGQRLRSREED